MARNRKRAKQRKAKRDASGGGDGIVRDDIPASLDHSSADVDEFEAKLVAGAEGTPADPKVDPSAGGVVHLKVSALKSSPSLRTASTTSKPRLKPVTKSQSAQPKSRSRLTLKPVRQPKHSRRLAPISRGIESRSSAASLTSCAPRGPSCSASSGPTAARSAKQLQSFLASL